MTRVYRKYLYDIRQQLINYSPIINVNFYQFVIRNFRKTNLETLDNSSVKPNEKRSSC